MKASTSQVIQGAVDKIKEYISLDYKVTDKSADNDDTRGIVRILSNGKLTFPDNKYEYLITSDKNQSFIFNGIKLNNTKIYINIDGKKSEFKILTHEFVDYTKDKITIELDSLTKGNELTIQNATTIFIKDTVVQNSSFPNRKTQTVKMFELEFHINSLDDEDGKEADDAIDYLQELLYSKLYRNIEFEIDTGAGVLRKTCVMMQGDLTYFDSIESKIQNNRQKRIATARFYFFIKY